ncbi:FecR domain-containing protein [Prevotella aurantiaca JCM 15754]|jgi:sigma factor regulatory protein, fecR/pupR family|uniref:FecR family protein n=1 Tax=Prevotella aurantiaca TaxID=596085 RepID=UPI00046965D1|nr:FecR domain-containing protein [Prevotella aurantiaca]
MKNLIEIDEILGKYFANEPLAEGEKRALMAYKDANRAEFDMLKSIMAQAETTKNMEYDVETAWNKIENHLTDATTQYNTRVLTLRRIFNIAASLLLLIGIGTLAYHYLNGAEIATYANNTPTENTVTLPDGSSVTLSPQASLTFKEEDGKRLAELEGQAFFDVEHGEKTFAVEAGALKVEVLGTSFTVNAEEQGAESVAVATGRVRVSANSQVVTLTQGEAAVNENGKLIASKQKKKAGEVREFVFNNTPLATAIKEIEKGMDVRIEMEKGLSNNRITTKLRTESPEEAVAELAILCNCQYEAVSSIHFKMHK